MGSIVSIWATGLGQTNPPSVDAQRQTDTSLRYQTDVRATVDGTAAEVLYAGVAPGFTGLSQINIRIPQSAPGPAALQLLVGIAPFKQAVQLWVRQ